MRFYLKIPYFLSNEHDVKTIVDRTESFTGSKIILIALWSTRNIKSLFPLKDKVAPRSCVMYEGQCLCNLRYIGETKRGSEVCWKKHKRSC